MAPSRCATSITWSVGTKRNSASLSTNFLISQGPATRSTLTCSRVIHFMGQLLLLFFSCAASLCLGWFAGELCVQGIIYEPTPFQGNQITRTDQANTLTDDV